MRRVILTFSGKVAQSEGSDIWRKVAGVMERAGGNIETAGGSFVRVPRRGDAEDHRMLLSVSAFGACIQPSRPMGEQHGTEDLLGCTMYVKAVLPSSRVGLMMRLLETQSPLEVYTVSLSSDTTTPTLASSQWSSSSEERDSPGEYMVTCEGGVPVLDRPDPAAAGSISALQAGQQVSVLQLTDVEQVGQVWARISEPPGWIALASIAGDDRWARKVDRATGTVYLFGVDRPGQLARITQVLREQRVTVLHLRVQSGEADLEKCDFVQACGGPLAENRMRIVFDESVVDLTRLRAEIQRVGEEVGYAVTCLTTDTQSQLRAWLPSYQLRRKAFTVAFAVARAAPRAALRRRRGRLRGPAS